MDNPLNKFESSLKNKTLIIFDLDGTLTESKSDIDDEMASLLGKLLEVKRVAIIGGGKYELFQRQVVSKLSGYKELLGNLFLFPTTATVFYRYNQGNWEKVFGHEFSKEEKEKVLSAFEKTFAGLNYKHPDTTYGEIIEDRGAEIAFSALGQEAPLELKKQWHKNNPDIRAKMESILQRDLLDMEVKVTGLTSIDVTRKGVDKRSGILEIQKYLNIPVEDILFVGDAFFYEGNDEPALRSGAVCFEVKRPADTKELINKLIS